MLLPLLAIVFAVASAFASTLVPQMAWHKSGPGAATQAAITVPENISEENPCGASGQTICKVNGFNAYATQDDANNSRPEGLLRYP